MSGEEIGDWCRGWPVMGLGEGYFGVFGFRSDGGLGIEEVCMCMGGGSGGAGVQPWGGCSGELNARAN